MEKGGATYITTNKNKTTLYTGATSDLIARIQQHQEGFFLNSFTKRYNVTILVWYELFHSIEEALAREKQIKGWTRVKKISLIESMNPEWKDLWEEVKQW